MEDKKNNVVDLISLNPGAVFQLAKNVGLECYFLRVGWDNIPGADRNKEYAVNLNSGIMQSWVEDTQVVPFESTVSIGEQI